MFADIIQSVLDCRNFYCKHIDRVERSIDRMLSVDTCRDFVANHGKRIRSVLFFMFSNKSALREKHYRTIAIIEIIHAASILHDDVIDNNTNSRRGMDSFLKQHGAKMSILAGDRLLINAVQEFYKIHKGNAYFIRMFLKTCSSMAAGALLEQGINASNRIPSINDYIKMASLKTGALFGLTCLLASNGDIKASTIGLCFGIVFQVQNDIDSYIMNDSISSEDYVQKNITFPIVIMANYFDYNISNFKNTTDQHEFDKIKRCLSSHDFVKINKSVLEKYIQTVSDIFNRRIWEEP